MFLTQNLLEALESLTSNKLRSGLTMLGIVIGVGAVIAMLSVGQGATATISGSISSIGTNLIFIIGSTNEEITIRRPLTLEDAEAIGDPLNAPSILETSVMYSLSRIKVSASGETVTMAVTAVTPTYDEIRNLEMAEGEFISETQMNGRASVAVLGVTTAENLFGTSEGLIGETVRLQGQPFRIIGIQASKGGSGFSDADDVLYVPYSTAVSRLAQRSGEAPNRVDMIVASAVSASAVPDASEEIRQILRTRHHTDIGKDDFTLMTQEDFLSLTSQIMGVLTIFLGGIAAISLLVGGIGIMNIMLVSVTERTREIGLRKALGARRRDILIQFLTESATLSVFGGLIGIALGAGLAFLVGQIATATGNAFTPVVGIDSVLLATLFSAAVGLFFGIYPASRAAGLEPVEALRYE
ncbi:MAG: ABC transporter permease [Anaerolineales bacterium]|nr:ABC transporter permease [Anaerolineales bacterium]